MAVRRAFEVLAPELEQSAQIEVDLDLRGYAGGRRRVEARSALLERRRQRPAD